MILPVVGLAALWAAASAKSFLQFVAVVAFWAPLLLPEVMPPPTQPVTVSLVVTSGFTNTLELDFGRPGLNVCVPWSDLHFGSTVLAAPAGPAAQMPSDDSNETADNKTRPLRMQSPLMDPLMSLFVMGRWVRDNYRRRPSAVMGRKRTR